MKSNFKGFISILILGFLFLIVVIKGSSDPKEPIAKLNYNQNSQNVILTVTKFSREKGKLRLEFDMKNNSNDSLITEGILSLIDNDKLLSLPLEISIANKTLEKGETKSFHYEWNIDKKPSVFDSIIVSVNDNRFRADLTLEDDQ
ncbi:hypothetical protein [Bacillus cereus]|uniref:hypothetical protein n=1 Tax=Bacillus cereus TaxID=1396 RepID=UPI0018F6C8B9|nr:hypothetical protein [Bacillus cereus]MBJ8025236.1 hypothetical protein [Bacillus cereus]MBJ8037664.1 hypothetical protein [Bacillus cereus]